MALRRPRAVRPLAARLVVLAAIALAIVAVEATPVPGRIMRIVPAELWPAVPPADLIEAAALHESAQALIDRSTLSGFGSEAPIALEAAVDPPAAVGSIKIFGGASCLLTVSARTADGWEPISGLRDLDLRVLPEEWRAFTTAAPVLTDGLRFDIVPAPGGPAGGVREIEIWGAGERVNLPDGTALVAAMARPAHPPQGIAFDALAPEAFIGPAEEGAAEDTADDTFVVPLDADVRQFRRAWLTYETSGLAHWVAAARALNDHQPQGGAFQVAATHAAAASGWTSQVEEINPAWLAVGENRIRFQRANGVGPAFGVRGVRLVAEIEDGANFVAALATNQIDSEAGLRAVRDGDLATGFAPYRTGQSASANTPTLTLELDRPSQVDGVELYLAGTLKGTIDVAVRRGDLWSGTIASAAGRSLPSGWSTISASTTDAVQAVRLTFSGGAGSQAEIREIAPLGSGVGAPATPPRIRVTYPDDGRFVGREAYVRGFVGPFDNGSGPATIYVAEREIVSEDGSFGVPVNKDDAGYWLQGDADNWTVSVRAVWPDGATATASVTLGRHTPAPESTDDSLLPPYSTVVTVGKGNRCVTYDAATLDIGGHALEVATTLTITPLRGGHLPGLDQGMTNVTRGPRRGYRFAPHGMKFRAPIRITLPYSRALIPPGLSTEDIRTFYFDDQSGSWKTLERVGIDATARTVTSLTDHFTDMINATVTVPDHPQPLSYNPTSMKDIKVADPGAGINLVEPPQANHMGEARLTYPMEVPPGRGGMQPQIGLQYNSTGGNGWTGIGWDLPVQKITIDTRWGVPRYDAALETETYMLAGEQLTPVAHRGALRPRAADGEFHTRVEGQFRRIIRHGAHPAGYWWEVIDKNGTRSFYGGGPDLAPGGAADAAAVLADPAAPSGAAPIFEWVLREMRDTNGNSVRYRYDVVQAAGGGEPARQIYLRSIRYTGTPAADGPYEVRFERSGGRADVMVDGRAGFKTFTSELLTGVEVLLTTDPNPLIRRYRLEYDTGPFAKSRLRRVVQIGEDGVSEFHRHEFDYFDEVSTASPSILAGFIRSFDFGGAETVRGEGLLFEKDSTAHGADVGRVTQTHLYVGISPGVGDKKVSAGGKVGTDSSRNRTKLSLVDINGDGAPDQVFESGGGVVFRPNLAGPATPPGFGGEIPLGTLPEIGRELASTRTFGVQGYAMGINGLADRSLTRTRGEAYLSDVNGDRLMDLVSGTSVRFNRLAGGLPVFSPDSPTPLSAGAASDAGGMVTDPDEQRAEMEETYNLVDPLRRFIAPHAGRVDITGSVRLLGAPPAGYRTADGVRVSIQHNGGEIFATTISDPSDLAPRAIGGLTGIPVQAGDRIYFRVNSRNDGSFDAVEFDPTIAYRVVESAAGGSVPADEALTDENGMATLTYTAGAEYAYGGAPLPWLAPFTGTATLEGVLSKSVVITDDVRLQISQNGMLLHDQTLTWDQTGDLTVSLALSTSEGDRVLVRLETDSRIDLARLRFAPRVVYQTVEGAPAPVDENGEPIFSFAPPVTARIFPRNAFTAPYVPWVAPSDGDVRVRWRIVVDPFAPASFDSDIALTVKRPGARLAKQLIAVRHGSAPPPSELDTVLRVAAGDVFYFIADATHPDSAAHIEFSGPTVIYLPEEIDEVPEPVSFDVHQGDLANQAFGGGFRRWSFGQYNGNETPQLIVESRLRRATGENDPVVRQFLAMIPFLDRDQYRAEDEDCWIAGGRMSASRRIVKFLEFPDGSGFGGARGVVRFGGARNHAVSISVLDFGAGTSLGKNWSDVDFMDFNGDAYPDVVGGGSVQTTLPNGALGGRLGVGGFGRVRESESRSFNVNLGATMSNQITNSRNQLRQNRTEMGSYNVSAGTTGGLGELEAKWDLVDVNGDGLPDYVQPGGSGLRVRLNLGYRFGAEESWGGTGTLRLEKSASVGVNLGGGIGGLGKTTATYSFGGGLSSTRSSAGAEQDLIDVNGDGLLDIVSKPLTALVDSDTRDLSVRFNTGSGFMTEQAWTGALPRPIRENTTFSRNFGLHFQISILVNLVPPIYLIINPGRYRGDTLGGFEVSLTDLDGDGYPDHVYSDDDGNVEARLNGHGRTNLLRTIRRPLGATIDLDYARSGNTTDQPGNRWVLSRVDVNDGLPGDGADRQLTTFTYAGGFYDRAERDFYGFRTVDEEPRDTTRGDALYRRIERTWRNRSFYEKGLMESERTFDADGRPFLATINSYDVTDVLDLAAVVGLEDFSATRFPHLARADRRFYEGQVAPGKFTFMTYDYDALGNVVRMFDSGDIGAADDVEATITYFSDPGAYIVGLPDSIVVRGDGRVMRERHALIEPGTGDLRQVRQLLEDGREAVTDLDYLPNGNLQRVTGPQNLHGRRHAVTFEYDPVAATHIAAIEDVFGYRSTATHHLKYGTVAANLDINAQPTTYTYDIFGRVSTITGPYETGGSTPTIAFEYHPEAAVPFARSRHMDTFRDPADPIETIQFGDGLKRVVQTKKDASVHVGPQAADPPEVMTVSGRLAFDHVGRAIEQFYPVTEEKGPQNRVFNPAHDSVAPARTAYDVLDRPVRTTIPDTTALTIVYGFGADRGGQPKFETVVTDANQIAKRTYRDVRELIVSVKELNKGGTETLWTSYAYDPLKQIKQVTDDRMNVTGVEYDNLGRRTVVDNPDTGRMETRYDLAGNIIARITANLRAEGKEIAYDYDFNRLKSVAYPNFAGNNVAYTYGGPGAPFNRANRVALVTDQSGSEERFYGRLGERVKEIRTIASVTSGASANSPEVYATEYLYDTWGRVQQLTYPDGEVLTYRYDAGGLLREASGVKAGYTYDYIRRLEYDKFEQRAFALFGNNTRTTYTYDPLDRRLAALQSGTGASLFQDLTYGYDDVGNILSLENRVPVPPPSQFGGPTQQAFGYDDLYRLTSASGAYQFAPDKTRRYALALAYDSIHNIVAKQQTDVIVQLSGASVPQHKTAYTFGYAYSSSGSGSVRPHAPVHVGDRTFTYDANGNQTGWTHDRNGTRRSIVWDEENRVQRLYDNGHQQTYTYDDTGERVSKRGPQGETVYVNPYFTVRNRSVATKHVFAGTSRAVSKLVYQENQSLNGNAHLPPVEKDLYFYHPDHLGSSSYVTDTQGQVYEHLEYFPQGEAWVQEASNTQRTPYLFTAKELDEETGLQYFGARYYDPRTAVWQSADPVLARFLPSAGDPPRLVVSLRPEWGALWNLPGMGGVYAPVNLNPYQYASLSPVRYVDPVGQAAGTLNKFWEMVKGAWTIGPYDAYQAAAGSDQQFAVSTMNDFARRHGVSPEARERFTNAVRHAAWQARLTRKHDVESAQEVGRLHELGEESSQDSYIDRNNNIVGRRIGAHAQTDEEIIAGIEEALMKGELITSWTDKRVPQDLPQYKGASSSQYGDQPDSSQSDAGSSRSGSSSGSDSSRESSSTSRSGNSSSGSSTSSDSSGGS